MVRQAVDARLEETDDLDWKESLPQPPRDGRWNEFAKDVAAMANTRGGLLIYGVSDSVDLVGIDPSSVNEQQLQAWIRNHVQPYLSGLDMLRLTDPESGLSVLVVDVPASQVAPHLVYGTAGRDKEQMAAVAPWRDGDHTAWMPEHRLARAYQDRFARQEQAGRELERHLDYAAELALSHSAPSDAWVVVAARLQRPVPRAVPAPSAVRVRDLLTAALQRSQELKGEFQRGMPVLRNIVPQARAGLRRWVVSNFLTSAEASGTRPVFAELHHDGTSVLATNLSWRALGQREDVKVPLPVRTDILAPAACDAVALATELRRSLLADSALDVIATVVAHPGQPHFTAVTDDYGHAIVPDYARRPPRFLPSTAEIPPAPGTETLREVARDLSAGILNQFGLTN